MNKKYFILLSFLFSFYLITNFSIEAQQKLDISPSSNDYGGIGLLQTRTARFSNDTAFELSRSYIFPYERFNVNIQMLPWVEGTFRYTSIENRSFEGNAIVRGTTFKDRAIDFKFRAWEESHWIPQIAVGFQDALGTGLFSGEYIVGSKRWEDFDFSFGVGWGYSGGAGARENPLIRFSDTFKTRSSSGRQGGAFVPGAWFSGDKIGFFGGVEYRTPLEGLNLKIEYDPHDYANDPVGNALVSSSKINYGFNYRPFHWIDIAFARERGQEYMLRVGLRTQFNDQGLPKIDPPPSKLKVRKTTLRRPRPSSGIKPSALVSSNSKLQPWFIERYKIKNNKLPISNLSQALVEEGVQIEKVSFDNKVLSIRILTNSYDVRYIAQLALSFSDLEIKSIIISNITHSETFTAEELRETSGVDYLFAQINRRGWAVDEVILNNTEMSIYVLPMAISSIHKFNSTEKIVLPPGVEKLNIFDRTEPNKVNKIYAQNLDQEKTRLISNENNNSLQLTNKNEKNNNNFTNVSLRFLEQARDALTGNASFKSLFSGNYIDNSWKNSQKAAKIIEALKMEKIKISKILFEPNRVVVHVFRGRYRIIPKNIGRTVRVIAENSSDEIELITVVLESKAGEIARITLQREQFERATLGVGSTQELWHSTDFARPETKVDSAEIYNPTLYPDFRYSIRPGLHQHIGGGDQFYLHQLFANVSTKIAVFEGFDIDAAIGVDLYNNFDRITTPSDSILPRVRSDIKHYLQRGHSTLRKLRANYMFSPLPDLYARLTAGYFEMMYGGFSGELLHRPFGSRYAYGFDLNYVRKREFKQLWGFQDYSVLTGHVNLYYSLPLYGLSVSSHIGQYLAGDRGVTQILSRRFDSGIVSGVWASATNIPAKTFGEGSFDKGFFIVIPMDLFASRASLHHGTFAFRPLTKDGGQMVDIEKLHGIVNINQSILNKDWKHILD